MIRTGLVGRKESKPRNVALGLCRESTKQSSAGRTHVSRILEVLRAQTGYDFSRYKESAILRVVESRIIENGVRNGHAYASYVESYEKEVQVLFSKLLIHVASFFRNPEAFAMLRRTAIPELLRGRPPNYVFRVWVPGCSTGEEAYSLAFLLQEGVLEANQACNFRIFGTDISKQAVALALAGKYAHSIASQVSQERLRRIFDRDQHGYRLRTDIHAMVAFGVQNVLLHRPSIRVDLISCRNLLTYLEADLQAELVTAFHQALRPGGVLFLSPSESIGNATELFLPVSRKWKLYRANARGPVFTSNSQSGAASAGGDFS